MKNTNTTHNRRPVSPETGLKSRNFLGRVLRSSHPGAKKGFTLVELIVVITILVILGTIAFVNLGNFSNSARDSARISDITNITQGLGLTLIKNGTIPPPEPGDTGVITITASGITIGYQGYAGPNLLSTIRMSDARDPTDKKYYTYSTNLSYTKYQLLSLLEDSSTLASYQSFPLITQTYAGYEKRTPITKGNNLGILLSNIGASLNQPVQELYSATTFTGVDIARTNTGYRAYFTTSDILEGTGAILQNLQISYTYGAGFSAPSTCPTGFIAVPGNKEFNQPGFCVAKYEMKYASTSGKGQCGKGNAALTQCNNGAADVVDRWNSWAWTTGNIPVSIPQGEPIAGISQSGAIAACQSMGPGYHLITNNEWMTITRDIEQQGDNWSTNQVGSGFLYSGNNDDGGGTNSWALPATADDTDGYYMTQDSAAGNGDVNNANCNTSTDTCGKGQKRTLKLSNNQVIWDLAGNVWEHVNGENSINPIGTGYASFSSNACGGAAAWAWFAFSPGSIADGVATNCTFQSPYSYSNQGPKTPNLNAANGIGRIYSYGTTPYTDRVFLRGGDGGAGAFSGVFTLGLSWNASTANRSVGFRCAR